MQHPLVAAALGAVVFSFAVEAACAASNDLPLIDHIVVVVMENHSFDQIVDPLRAPFLHRLAMDGALFVNSFAVTHPSQPNYFALFSGSTQGITDDEDHTFDVPTLASALKGAGKSFIGYVETGSPRKHNPWESFVNARATERNFSEFPREFTQLPTISFVIPSLNHDMHDGSVRMGDNWLRFRFNRYAEWAKTHNSLLIITFDEDDGGPKNHIPTIIYGAHVRPGAYAEHLSHYRMLSTLLALYGLTPFAEAATAPPIVSIWEKWTSRPLCHEPRSPQYVRRRRSTSRRSRVAAQRAVAGVSLGTGFCIGPNKPASGSSWSAFCQSCRGM